jgi:hypothetical protein
MPHPAIQKFIGELKTAKFPYFTTETQVVCGRVTLTATPGIESESIHSLRMDLPADVQPSESPYWLLFFVAVFDAQTFCDIRPRIREEMHSVGHFDEVIRDWRLRLFQEDGHRVMIAEATSVPAA